jgi:glycerol uptake operon antiterminator
VGAARWDFLDCACGMMRIFFVFHIKKGNILEQKRFGKENFRQQLKFCPVIPSVHQRKELLYAMEETDVGWIMLKLGDVNTLPRLIKLIHQSGKRVMVHQDSIKGIARDKMGIQYMANCGVDCVITMKPPCIKYIKDAEMFAAFGFFIIDSDAYRTGLMNIKECEPDGVVLMPGTIPEQIIKGIAGETTAPIMLGGLMTTEPQILNAVRMGVVSVATSNPELWKLSVLKAQ